MYKTREDFLSAYNALSKIERRIVNMFAVAYEPINQTTGIAILNFAGFKDEKGTSINPNTYKILIAALQAKKFLQVGTIIRFNLQFHAFLMRSLGKAKILRYKAYLDVAFPYKNVPHQWASSRSEEATVREMYLAAYCGEMPRYNELLHEVQRSFYNSRFKEHEFINHFSTPFDADFVSSLHEGMQIKIVNQLFGQCFFQLENSKTLIEFLKASPIVTNESDEDEAALGMRQLLGIFQITQGEISDVLEKVPKTHEQLSRQAWVTYLKGDTLKALATYEVALKNSRKELGKNTYFQGAQGPYHLLAMLKGDTPELKKVETILSKSLHPDYAKIYKYIESVMIFLQNRKDLAHAMLVVTHPDDGYDCLFYGLALYWTKYNINDSMIVTFKKYHKRAIENGYRWIAFEFATLLSKLTEDPIYEKEAAQLEKELGVESIINSVKI